VLSLKFIHMAAAALSVGLFALRGGWMLAESPLREARWTRIVPHVIDTVFLATGIWLAIRIGQYPFVQPWLTAKVLALVGYIVLGHKAAQGGADSGVERLGAAMAIACVLIVPVGLTEALSAFGTVELVLAGVGVGVCSSVVPYVCDQLAMSRLPRASFALLLALLPATATIVAAAVLGQIPTPRELAGVAFVMIGIATHERKNPSTSAPRTRRCTT